MRKLVMVLMVGLLVFGAVGVAASADYPPFLTLSARGVR